MLTPETLRPPSESDKAASFLGVIRIFDAELRHVMPNPTAGNSPLFQQRQLVFRELLVQQADVVIGRPAHPRKVLTYVS